MSERDRQNPYGRSEQQGGGYRSESNSPNYSGQSGQANQWQSDSSRQHGSDWQQDSSQRGGSDDHSSDYRFSGQGSQGGGDFGSREQGSGDYGSSNYGSSNYGRSQDFSRGASQDHRGGSNYRGQLNDADLRRDQRDASRNYERARGGYGPDHDRGAGYGQGRDWQSSQGQQNSATRGYAGRDYDASGGNDFGSFTSEDYGGRDFSNRGGVSGGARSSESYRPSYGVGAWLNRDDEDRQGRSNRSGGSGREDYGSWRQYGESRGFLERASDEVASWFGNEDASRRRDQDHRQDQQQGQSYGQQQSHRGRGPSNYTRSDERIREDANDHLTHDHHVDASHITVSVKDGELTLDGTVESRDAKRRAEDCVEHISGVKHVQNNLRVQDRSTSSSSYGSSGSGLAGTSSSSYGQSAGQTAGLGSSTTGSSGSSSGLSGSTAASTTGSTSTTTPSSTTSSTGGANTTEGIGSTATAGVGSTSRTSDKTS
ncbi:BON domain-containing protein [Novosphingobium sp. 9U]|uniref:BON domain-containing protein n=1 Tax=Novosphingobium sp. 9U TaxID=2653158 RepID=UPI0012F1F83E|nr:BON domain-containing protein [Novosphingobium sp. 9U]VWX53602.1 conserved hypothetical protein [Novosphingobium sp. 9U]